MIPTSPYSHTDYEVVEANSVADLEAAVNQKIADNWSPVGGVTVGLLNKLYQAMVKAESV